MNDIKVIVAIALLLLGMGMLILHLIYTTDNWEHAKEGLIPYASTLLFGLAYLLTH